MPEEPDDWELRLRAGLRDLPAPPVSADFDVRVLASLARPDPWWQALWHEARPLLMAAGCSLAVTLALVSWSSQIPSSPSMPTPPPLTRPLDLAALDRLIERPDLHAGGLYRLHAVPPQEPPASSPDFERRRIPGRAGLPTSSLRRSRLTA